MAVIQDLSKAQLAFQVEGGPVDRFPVVRFRGTEGLCQLYRFEIDLTSTEMQVDFDTIVGQAAVLSVNTSNGTRWFHGVVSRFEMTGHTYEQNYFRAELVPAVWLLTHRYGSRIFQGKTVPEIVSDVLTQAGIASDRFRQTLTGSHKPREYCVQYRETDYNFICRLMEEEGIWWYFEQTQDGHVMVMADASSAYAPIEGEAKLPYQPPSGMNVQEEHIFRFRLGKSVRPAAVVLDDFNFEDPKLKLQAKASGGEPASLEFYDYPGEYLKQDDGNTLATLRSEEFVAGRVLAVGASNSCRLGPARTFEMIEHPSSSLNAQYMVTLVRHQGKESTTRTTTATGTRAGVLEARIHQALLQAREDSNQTIRGLADGLLQIATRLGAGDPTAHRALTQWLYHAGQVSRDVASTAVASGANPLEALALPNLIDDIARAALVDYDAPVYECAFECIPADVSYRPPRVTPWPVMRGSQTARVVGPAGEEIHCDKYGRVKVQFHWDREGKFDDNSSCWIRVAQNMAGGQYGIMFIPRVGQEVIVDFLEGDPDKPIITGRVFNADHMPPYKLPDEKTKSVIKTHSSKGGGGTNEIRFEDLKDKEQLFIQAQRQMDLRVKASHFHTVGGSYHLIVGGEKDGELHGAYLQLVYKEKRTHVKDFREMWIQGDDHYFVEGMQYVAIMGDHLQVVQGNVRLESRGRSIQASTYSVLADTIQLKANQGIELVCGGSSIVLCPGGIYINGPTVYINSGAGPSQPAAPNVATPATSDADPGAADRSRPGRDVNYTGGETLVEGEVPSDLEGWEFPETPPPEPKPPPTIQARWSKPAVTPNHNSAWPPATPPTDVVPEEAKVQMLVTTTNVPDETMAEISILHCHTGASVHEGYLSRLVVRGNQVVDSTTGAPPEWVFEAKHRPWDPWDKPFFYFRVVVHYRGLQAETPRDFRTREAECLRVIYWHACVSDALADGRDGVHTQNAMAQVAGILGGLPHTRVLQQPFNQNNVPVALWGSVVRNSYTYHHVSHGDIVDRTTGAQLNDPLNRNPPGVPVGNWRSVVVLGDTSLGDAEVRQANNVPSTPRYLAYFCSCVTGWEPSFANAIIARGTRNVLAFRMYIFESDAYQMARDFYRAWCNTHRCNPEKIPEVFFDVGAAYYDSMRPVLFGAGGGAILSPAQRALQAIGNALSSFVSGIGSLFH